MPPGWKVRLQRWLQRWPWLTRLLNRLWDEYDRLSELQRVGLGVGMALVLASSSLYCLGAASLIALSRTAPSVSAEAPPPTLTPSPAATAVDPISPLLADRTPTLRPTATATPTGRPGATPRGTVRPGVLGASSPTLPRGATSTPGPARAGGTLTPTLSRGAGTPAIGPARGGSTLVPTSRPGSTPSPTPTRVVR